MKEVYAILKEHNINLAECSEDDRKARIAAEIIVSRMPALTRHFGKYVIATRSIEGFTDSGTVTITRGISLRVEGCMFYGTPDNVQSAMRVTAKNGDSICIPWKHAVFLIEENSTTVQFVKLIKSKLRIPCLPVSMRAEKFQEYSQETLDTFEREIVGSIGLDLAVLAISQPTALAADNKYVVYLSREKANRSYFRAEISLDSWYEELTAIITHNKR